MKYYCVLLCLFVFSVSSYAQKKEVIVVAVGSESELVGSREREIIMSVFQEKLIENFDVRLTNDDNVYSRYKYYEEKYGESGAIPMDSVLPSGREAGATYHCLILITNNYEFKANIWSMRDGRATKQMAFYPGLEVSYDKIIRDLKDVKALQIISMRLLKGFGYKVDDGILKQAEDEYWQRQEQKKKEQRDKESEERWDSFFNNIKSSFNDFKDAVSCGFEKHFKPYESGVGFYLHSNFNKSGYCGCGLDYSRSYFKLGVEYCFGNLDAFRVDVDERGYLYGDDVKVLESKFDISSVVYDDATGGVIKEYSCPRMEFYVIPGLMFKYFSLDCGLGGYVCRTVSVNNMPSFSNRYDASSKSEFRFAFRPSVSVYLGNENSAFRVTLGYNIVPSLKEMNCLKIGIGFMDW